MKMVVYFGDESDPYNNTFDLWAQREREEIWQTAEHNYMRRCPTAGNGIDCITMWLNNGDLETYIMVDNIRISGPNPVVEAPTLRIDRSATGATLTFTGTLQAADDVQGSYADVVGAKSPLSISTNSRTKFYRAKN